MKLRFLQLGHSSLSCRLWIRPMKLRYLQLGPYLLRIGSSSYRAGQRSVAFELANDVTLASN